ncbi:MAG TPA: hypothetical protein VHN82_08640 [Methanoregula sp.]|nr:hypothetical protein [Methanoregula sp.]
MRETQSPLARLVLFMVGLTIAGTILGGVHYIVVDIPAQQTMPPPVNYDGEGCARCMATCAYQVWDDSCVNNCARSCDCNPRCYYE